MGATAAVATIGSSVLGAYAQEKAGRAQQDVANWNADVAEQQAQDAIARGDVAAKRQQQVIKQTIGAQRAALAAQGLDLKDGSALDVQMNTAGLGALDVVTIKNNAAREAWGYRVNADNYRMQGEVARKTADANAFGTLLGGGASLVKQFGWGK